MKTIGKKFKAFVLTMTEDEAAAFVISCAVGITGLIFLAVM
jgi:hypothetical protein